MRATVAAGLLAVAAAVTIPPPGFCPRMPGLDPSYRLALNLAHDEGWVHGRDIVFPYGPLGWFTVPDPELGGASALFAQWAVFALFLVGLHRLARRGRAGTAVAVTTVVAAWVDPLATMLGHLPLAAMVWAMCSFGNARRSGGELAMVGALAATAVLVKVDAGAIATALFVGLLFRETLVAREGGGRRGPPLVPVLVFLTTLLLGYGLSSGGLGGLPNLLFFQLELALGYEAMSREGPPWRTAFVWLGLAAVPFAAWIARDRAPVVRAAIFVTVPVLLLAKTALVRQGIGHVLPFLPRLALLLGFLVLAAAGRDRRRVLVVTWVALLAGAALVAYERPSHRTPLSTRLSGVAFGEAVADAWDPEEAARRAANLGERRLAPSELPPAVRRRIEGASVDVVPWNVGLVAANDLSWAPRPIFQDYTAYTPRLDGLNARHWREGVAARFVLADVRTIDGRHVFLEAPLGWIALLDHYDLAVAMEERIVLERRDAPRFGPEVALGRTREHLGRPFEVPARPEPVVMRADVGRSAWGRLRSGVLGAPPLHLEATSESGRRRRWRVVLRNLPSGAIVSALPQSAMELAELFDRGAASDPVRTLEFQTDHPASFDGPVTVRWSFLPRAE